MTTNMPMRSKTGGLGSDDEAIPDADPSDDLQNLYLLSRRTGKFKLIVKFATSKLLLERLQAYKHACGYLESYFAETEKVHKAHAKEYEKCLKTVSHPLKEGHHFDQQTGGIASLFENIRSNTQGISNSHLETEKAIKGSVLPILERLHTEIKNKNKELSKGATKGSKEVDKTRNITQRHIELLGQHTASFSSSGGKVDAANDPYILQRGVRHRLNKQVLEENNNRHDLLEVQNSFQQFEAHVIRTFQQAMEAFVQFVGGQNEKQKLMYADMVGTVQRIPPDFEFKGFVHRNSNTLIDPSSPQRNASHISFPNQDHIATQPLIAGTLQRKSRAALKGYSTYHYVVTRSKFLHEFKDDDDIKKDPTPELSLYLPDCTVGGIAEEKFNVKGKDASKGKVGSTLAMSHELSFKASTASDAQKWWSIIREAAGDANYTGSAPVSPVESRNTSAQYAGIDPKQPTPVDTTNVPRTGTQGSGITSGGASGTPANSAVPGSAGGYGGMGPAPGSGGIGASPASGAPHSGVDRAPGQY